jgi:hypothetical protein
MALIYEKQHYLDELACICLPPVSMANEEYAYV